MPQFQTTTREAKSVWKSPDGQREIFEVVLDYEGQPVKASTYSNDIATVGWKGTVETYEKEGKGGRPPQTFVKQPPKENPGYGSTSGGSSRSNYVPKDEKAIQAMWAIGQSVNAHVGDPQLDVSDLSSVKAYAIELNAMVAEVKADGDAETTVASQETPPERLDVVVEPDLDGQTDLLADISDILPDSPKGGETPWQRS